MIRGSSAPAKRKLVPPNVSPSVEAHRLSPFSFGGLPPFFANFESVALSYFSARALRPYSRCWARIFGGSSCCCSFRHNLAAKIYLTARFVKLKYGAAARIIPVRWAYPVLYAANFPTPGGATLEADELEKKRRSVILLDAMSHSTASGELPKLELPFPLDSEPTGTEEERSPSWHRVTRRLSAPPRSLSPTGTGQAEPNGTN